MTEADGSSPELRVVADLGNSRLKWGLPVGPAGATVALPTDDPGGLGAASERWPRWSTLDDRYGQPSAGGAARSSDPRWVTDDGWYRSAAEVPVRQLGRRGRGGRPGHGGRGALDATAGTARAWSCRAVRRSPSSGSRPKASGRGPIAPA